jgi:RNA polymerase sigma-70 factor (ECF subfamily)
MWFGDSHPGSVCVALDAPRPLMARLGLGPAVASPVASPAPVERGSAASIRSRETTLRDWVNRYLDFVARVLRNAGTPDADVDDAVQRTFIAAANRLDDIRPGSEKSFLLQTALNVAAHARRTLARRREVSADEAPELIERFTPEQLTDQKRARQLLDRILDEMDVDLRTVFLLYEFEQMSMTEISASLEIPRGTVASRLRRARADFQERVSVIERRTKGEVTP